MQSHRRGWELEPPSLLIIFVWDLSLRLFSACPLANLAVTSSLVAFSQIRIKGVPPEIFNII